MQKAMRPAARAGIALVGASVIAMSPLAPPPATASATTSISTAAVQLTSTVDPLTRWSQVATNTGENLGELGAYWMNNPMPITRQLITNVQTYADWISSGVQNTIPKLQYWAENQVAPAFELAVTQFQAGNVQQAVKTMTTVLAFNRVMFTLMPMMDLMKIPTSIGDHAAAVVREIFSINTMSPLFNGMSNVVMKTADSMATSAQAAIDAIEAGDVPTALTAVANAPANAIDSVLNSPSGLFDYRVVGGCGCIVTGGTVLNLVLRKAEFIAQAIALPKPESALPVAKISAPDTAPVAPAQAPVHEPEAKAEATTEDDSAPADTAAVNASSTGAKDLSTGNKVTPGKPAAATSRTGQQLRTSLQNAAGQVDKSAESVRDDIKKRVKSLTKGPKKAAASKAGEKDKSDAGSGDK